MNKKVKKKEIESFIISWNLRFKYDRVWRKKYNIPFGSSEHRDINQIDIYIDILEDRLFDKAQLSYSEKIKNMEDYKKTGVFLKEEVIDKEEEDKIFKKIKLK